MANNDPFENYHRPAGSVYKEGTYGVNSNKHVGNDETTVTALAQAVGKNREGQPEVIEAAGGALATTGGLSSLPGDTFFYFVNAADVATGDYVTGTEGKVKKIVGLPEGVLETDDISVTVLKYASTIQSEIPSSIKTFYEKAVHYFNASDPSVLEYNDTSAAQVSTSKNPDPTV